MESPPRIALVVNPQTCNAATASLWQRAAETLRRRAQVCGELATCAGSTNVEAIQQLLAQTRPEVVVAAGGDGTVNDVVHSLMGMPLADAPILAILPFGTGNNVARAVGLRSVRQHREAAVDLAVAAAVGGNERRIDVGQVNAAYFVGSFAIGMDADILATRNRLRRRLQLGRRLGGYPLYLWSCAVNVGRAHGGDSQLRVDGAGRACRFYNLLVTNTPLYAGEFRFDVDNAANDGCLDLLVFPDALDYLRRYPQAWRRHVRYGNGVPVRADRIERVREVEIQLPGPVPSQLDGEECPPAASYKLRAIPAAVRVRVA